MELTLKLYHYGKHNVLHQFEAIGIVRNFSLNSTSLFRTPTPNCGSKWQWVVLLMGII